MTDAPGHSNRLLIQGLEHEDFFVRAGAISLLSDDRDPGIEATHAAISAIERFGWDDAYDFSHQIARLPLDREAVDWAVRYITEAHTRPPDRYPSDRYPPERHLLNWLGRGPVDLFPRWAEPLRIDLEEDDEFAEIPKLRTTLRSITTDACLDHLDQIVRECTEAGHAFPHAPVSRINWICERLAEENLPGDDMIAEWLDCGFQDEADDQLFEDYRSGAALIAIRHRRCLPVAASTVLRLFEHDWDWHNEEIERFLKAAAGRDDLLDILDLFPSQPWHARLYLTSVLAANRHPGLEERVLQLAAKEDSEDLLNKFAYILAAYGTPETRESARRLLASLPSSPEKEPAQQLLYAWCRLLNEEWEELPEWKSEFADGGIDPELLSNLSLAMHTANGPAQSQPKIGRNAPCPCGSGKKYKKCCLDQG